LPLVLAIALSASVSVIALWLGALSRSGAAAAVVVGSLIVWPTGWAGFAVLGVFYAASTFVSRLSRSGEQSDQRDTDVRDASQVLSNGGAAAIGALAEFVTPGLGLWLATITLAASGGDTWATSMGSLSLRPPRDILRGRVVAPGTSGGVTWFGTSGGLMGAALIGLTGMAMGGMPILFLAAAVIGQGAVVVDSLLGSAAQAKYHCPHCDQPTERPVHRCGSGTTLIRGFRWLDNNAVNAVTSGVALTAGFIAWLWLVE
jgi:uncharacterized protein (TIGR00297 family)